jgi:hypothetical protein
LRGCGGGRAQVGEGRPGFGGDGGRWTFVDLVREIFRAGKPAGVGVLLRWDRLGRRTVRVVSKAGAGPEANGTARRSEPSAVSVTDTSRKICCVLGLTFGQLLHDDRYDSGTRRQGRMSGCSRELLRNWNVNPNRTQVMQSVEG